MTDVIRHDTNDRWGRGDLQALAFYVARGKSYREIADLMGRTVGAVRSKLYRLRRAG